jgi:hypothetical protein
MGTGTELVVTCNLPVCDFELRGCDRLNSSTPNKTRPIPHARIQRGEAGLYVLLSLRMSGGR